MCIFIVSHAQSLKSVTSIQIKRSPCLNCWYFPCVKNKHSEWFICSCSRRSSKCITKNNFKKLWVFFFFWCLLLFGKTWNISKYLKESEQNLENFFHGRMLSLFECIDPSMCCASYRLQSLPLPEPWQGHFRVQLHWHLLHICIVIFHSESPRPIA